MRLEELTDKQIIKVVDSWARNFGFHGVDRRFHRATVPRGVREDLTAQGYYESRIGTRDDDDCKLRFRISVEDDNIEVSFDFNKGQMTAAEYDPKLGEAESRFRTDVEKAGFRYYDS